ncbi:hypothetical protein HID58_072006 [Brassica napus]|uniref:Uncharacterized protein n=1 Tax=Brassica napus TaxID=3708 RepID=A0ABQ7Z3D2_BRANA|nr:hypothetical protein HID58_072006 [Brassica napus]
MSPCYGIRRASLGLCLAFCFSGPTTSDATTGEKETLTRPDSRLRVLRFSSIGGRGDPVSVTSGRCSSVVDAMLLRYWEARNVKGGGELMWISVVKPQPGDRILNAYPFHGILLETPRMISFPSSNWQPHADAMYVNEGRLRILGETAKSHQVAGLITTIHSDLRVFARYNMINCCLMPRVLESVSSLRERTCTGTVNWRAWKNLRIYRMSFLILPPNPEENQGRVEAFLLRHPLSLCLLSYEFSVDPVDRLVPSSFVTSQGVFLSNPVKHSLDGAFAVRLVRAL